MTTKTQTASFSAAVLRWVYPASGAANGHIRFPGIFIKPHSAGGVVLVATDGNIIAAAYDAKGTASAEFQIIPSETTISICNKNPGREDADLANQVHISDGTLTLAFSYECLEDALHIQPGNCTVDTQFPGYQALFRKGQDLVAEGTGQLDYRLLSRLLSGLPDDHETCVMRIMTPKTDEDYTLRPHFVQFSSLPFCGVIMPISPEHYTFEKPFDWFIEV